MSTKQDNSTTFDPSRRRLCPDGSCIGLIGTDGKCAVCGTLGSGGTGVTAASSPALPTPPPESDARTEDAPASDAAEAFDPKRRLCPDEACIGVIGSNNRCSICGRQG
ncbi:MAG: hypothetical protein ABSF35_02795 [Polyangia bacterium]|jgi:hypothetical protein